MKVFFSFFPPIKIYITRNKTTWQAHTAELLANISLRSGFLVLYLLILYNNECISTSLKILPCAIVPLFRKDKVTLEKHPPKYKEEHNFLFFSDYRLYFLDGFTPQKWNAKEISPSTVSGALELMWFSFFQIPASLHTHTSTAHTPSSFEEMK